MIIGHHAWRTIPCFPPQMKVVEILAETVILSLSCSAPRISTALSADTIGSPIAMSLSRILLLAISAEMSTDLLELLGSVHSASSSDCYSLIYGCGHGVIAHLTLHA
mgnify:CR=1 FL=1